MLADAATEDAAHLLGAGAATDLITELFETQTKVTGISSHDRDDQWLRA